MMTAHYPAIRWFATAAVAASALMLIGCGDDDGQAATVAPPPTSTVAPTSTTTPAATDVGSTTVGTVTSSSVVAPPTTSTPPTTTPPTTAAAGLFAVDPQDVIIRLEDLPAGWAQASEDILADDGSNNDCGSEVFEAAGLDPDAQDQGGMEEVESTFSQGAFGPFLMVGVGITTQDAAAVFDLLPEAMAACDGTTDANGNTARVLPVSFPQLGDDTFAARIDVEGTIPASALFGLVRQGDVVLTVVHFAVGGTSDAELVESSLQTMLDRI